MVEVLVYLTIGVVVAAIMTWMVVSVDTKAAKEEWVTYAFAALGVVCLWPIALVVALFLTAAGVLKKRK